MVMAQQQQQQRPQVDKEKIKEQAQDRRNA